MSVDYEVLLFFALFLHFFGGTVVVNDNLGYDGIKSSNKVSLG